MHVTEKRIEIRAPVERVFDLFSDFESFPRWMKNIREVRYTGRRFTRWAAEAPLGMEVEWEAETTAFDPDRRIAWRSVRGDVETEGEVTFEETRRGTTLVRVVLGYALPAGRLGELVARLFGKNPERQLEDDLERFATVVEGRRPRSRRDREDEERRDERGRRERHERSIGRRAAASGPTDRAQRDERFDERRPNARLDRRERDYYEAPDGRRPFEDEGAGYEDERRRPGRGERARFEEALRAARESQLESRRRYAAERERRERDAEARYTEEREQEEQRFQRRPTGEPYERQRRAAFDELDEGRRREDESRRGRPLDELPRRRREAERDYDDEEDYARSQGRRRHALTPRERELERERHEPDRGYTEEAFRRGVEKLMDEPPSRRWRRWE